MKSLFLVVIFALLSVNAIAVTEDWIFVFHNNVTEEKRNFHMDTLGEKIFARYSIGNQFHAFAASLSNKEMLLQRTNENIKYVEKDGIAHISQACNVQGDATWGINRISERKLILSGDYKYSEDGEGAVAFIIDTGIRTTHTEFDGGRATFGANFVPGESNTDCNGHGTHVAGTVGGKTYGVAKKVSLVAVKVLGCAGSGSWTGVISGIDWAAKQRGTRPGVANMSLGGGKNQAVNDAVAAAISTGLTFALAAGNNNGDACTFSPASEPTAISVGATSIVNQGSLELDARSYFSNYGTCVHILAPGSLITSAWITSDTSINTISGTSMASPHVAGAAALYLAANPNATPDDVKDFLVAQTTPDVVRMDCGVNAVCAKTPNKLLYSACDSF